MKFSILLFLALSPLFAVGQRYFEGSIHYVHEVNVKSKKINLAYLEQAVGKGSVLSFKDGNFLHNYDGGEFEFELYNRLDNRLYLKKRSTDTIYWYDCSKGGISINGIKTSKKRKEVLGMPCNRLRVRYSDHIKVEYYNSDSISIDPQWFVAYKRDDQYKIDALEKSIFLRSEIVYSKFTVVSRAIKLEREPLSMSIFEIPLNAILLKKE